MSLQFGTFWGVAMTCNDNNRDIRVVSLLPHVPTLHLFDCECARVYVPICCTCLQRVHIACIFCFNVRLGMQSLRCSSRERMNFLRAVSNSCNSSFRKQIRSRARICLPCCHMFFSTGIFGLINFRGQIHRY